MVYTKEKSKIYQKEYYQKNIEIFREKGKLHYQNNKKKINKRTRLWQERNKEKVKLIKNKANKKYDFKYPEKKKAQNYAHYYKQRDTTCSKCGNVENLQFHHTNYEKNEGFTLCTPCHVKKHHPY